VLAFSALSPALLVYFSVYSLLPLPHTRSLYCRPSAVGKQSGHLPLFLTDGQRIVGIILCCGRTAHRIVQASKQSWAIYFARQAGLTVP
jgi:hypothetical protein